MRRFQFSAFAHPSRFAFKRRNLCLIFAAQRFRFGAQGRCFVELRTNIGDLAVEHLSDHGRNFFPQHDGDQNDHGHRNPATGAKDEMRFRMFNRTGMRCAMDGGKHHVIKH